MRHSRNVEILEDEDKKPIGIILGADYVAEHENGIDHLHQIFGCLISADKKALGMEARSMTTPFADMGDDFFSETHTVSEKFYSANAPGKRAKVQKTKVKLLGFFWSRCPEQDAKKRLDYIISLAGPRYTEETDFTAGWDEKSFLIAGWTEKAHQVLAFLEDGMQTADFALWLGGAGGNPFARNGLVLARPSAVPASSKDIMLKADQARLNLAAMAEATGIQKKIDDKNGSGRSAIFAKHSYHALSPCLISDEKKEKSQHPVMFFLNPMQRDASYGYFSVEELELWLEDKGPIPKSNCVG